VDAPVKARKDYIRIDLEMPMEASFSSFLRQLIVVSCDPTV